MMHGHMYACLYAGIVCLSVCRSLGRSVGLSYICIHVYAIYTYICICKPVCIYFICTYVYMYICIYVYMYMCICIYFYIRIYIYICIYIHMYICIYVYLYIRTYVHLCLCICICMMQGCHTYPPSLPPHGIHPPGPAGVQLNLHATPLLWFRWLCWALHPP